MSTLPVLMYHGIHAHAHDRGRFDEVYSVHPQCFARQLDWLVEQGYTCVLPGETERLHGTRDERRLLITFDDGDVSNVEVALPLLQARGMRAVFFVTSGFIDQPGMLASRDVRALAEAGMRIGSHGATHLFLEDLSDELLAAELRDSRQRLHEASGLEIDAIALPGGRGGVREAAVAQAAGYRHLYGSVPGPNRHVADGCWQQRIAITRGTDMKQFEAMVRWRGWQARKIRGRYEALRLCKRMLGNERYQRLRAGML